LTWRCERRRSSISTPASWLSEPATRTSRWPRGRISSWAAACSTLARSRGVRCRRSGRRCVVTHRHRKILERQGGTSFTFVTGGIQRAVALARDAASGKDVAVAGGGTLLRQVLAAGLLDEALEVASEGRQPPLSVLRRPAASRRPPVTAERTAWRGRGWAVSPRTQRRPVLRPAGACTSVVASAGVDHQSMGRLLVAR
jgi:hypothetical protein